MKRIFCLAVLLTITANADTAAGFRKLWRNETALAVAEFRAAVALRPADADAWRGLGWTTLMVGDEPGLLRAWRPLFKLAPSQPETAALWPRFAATAQSQGQVELLHGAARDVLAAKTSSELRAAALLTLGRAGDLNYVRNWKSLGPFSFALGGNAPPETSTRSADWRGIDDQPMRWRAFPTGRDGVFRVAQYLGDGGPAVFFAATALQADAQKVQLRLDLNGAAKVWLNNTLVMNESAPLRRANCDLLRVSVTLQSGWNSLLVKLADARGDGEFSLRLTAPDGSPLALNANPDNFRLGRLGGNAPPAEVPLAAALRGPDLEIVALQAGLQREAGRAQAAVDLLSAALAELPAPQPGWLQWELAQALEAAGLDDLARTATAQAVALCPSLLAARLAQVEEDEASLGRPARLDQLKSLLAVSPNSPAIFWKLAAAHEILGNKPEAARAARAAAQNQPGPAGRAALSDWLALCGLPAGAEKTLDDALREFPTDAGLLRRRAERLPPGIAAETAWKLLAALDDDEPAALRGLAVAQEKLRPAAAQATWMKLRSLRPQDGSVAQRLGLLLLRRGDKKGAREALRAALEWNPALFTVREELRRLTGEPLPLDILPAAATPKPASPTKNRHPDAEILLDEARQVVYADLAATTHGHFVVRIHTAAGARQWQSFTPHPSSSEVQVIIENARAAWPGTNAVVRGSTVTSRLAPGAVLDVRYRIEEFHKGPLARLVWGQRLLGHRGAPVRLARYALVAPPEVVLNWRALGKMPPPKMRDLQADLGRFWRVREWNLENLPAGPPRRVEISSLTFWGQVADWFEELAGPACLPGPAVKAKAEELARGLADDSAKLAAFEKFVADQITTRPASFDPAAIAPTGGQAVLRNGCGAPWDKATLLVALCTAADIPARLALFSRAEDAPLLPSPRFGGVAVVIQNTPARRWFNPASRRPAIGAAGALVIGDKSSGLEAVLAGGWD